MNRVGLLIGCCLAAVALGGFGCQKSQSTTGTDTQTAVSEDFEFVSQKQGGDSSVVGGCATARFPFACVVDQAIASGDPNDCNRVGESKRMACVEAYQEIKGAPIECGTLTDPALRQECMKKIGSLTKQEAGQSLTASTTEKFVGADGLKVDNSY